MRYTACWFKIPAYAFFSNRQREWRTRMPRQGQASRLRRPLTGHAMGAPIENHGLRERLLLFVEMLCFCLAPMGLTFFLIVAILKALKTKKGDSEMYGPAHAFEKHLFSMKIGLVELASLLKPVLFCVSDSKFLRDPLRGVELRATNGDNGHRYLQAAASDGFRLVINRSLCMDASDHPDLKSGIVIEKAAVNRFINALKDINNREEQVYVSCYKRHVYVGMGTAGINFMTERIPTSFPKYTSLLKRPYTKAEVILKRNDVLKMLRSMGRTIPTKKYVSITANFSEDGVTISTEDKILMGSTYDRRLLVQCLSACPGYSIALNVGNAEHHDPLMLRYEDTKKHNLWTALIMPIMGA